MAVQNHKDFFGPAIVALGHRVDLYSRLESTLFHTKIQKYILWLFSFIHIYIFSFFFLNIQKIDQKHSSDSTIKVWKKGSYDS